MKLFRLTIVLMLGFGFAQVCKASRSAVYDSSKTSTWVIVFQDGVETLLESDVETIEIKKKDFSLRFYNKRYNAENAEFYTAQIAAFTNAAELDKVEVGMLKSEVPCFRSGTGMAAREDGYSFLIFKNNAHHYLYYESSENKRLNLLDDSGELLKLEFEINVLYIDKVEVELPDTKLKGFYLAIVIDRNLNGSIEKGELTKLTIKLK